MVGSRGEVLGEGTVEHVILPESWHPPELPVPAPVARLALPGRRGYRLPLAPPGVEALRVRGAREELPGRR